MNSLFKYIILSTLVLVMMSSASAMFNDLNVWDVNGSRHANRGEDFNVIISDGALRAHVNTDYNYLVALSYSDSRGIMYLDLNINVFADSNVVDSNYDGNVVRKTLTDGVSGTPCYGGGDWNVLQLKDSNVFNIKVTVPSTGTAAVPFVGKPVLVELWSLTSTGPTSARCVAKVADGNFIIGPAIIVKTSNASDIVAKIDQNIAIYGFGFTPSLAYDNNVTIFIWDANGTGMSAINYTEDMNISKSYVSKGDSLLGTFHRERTDLDTNGQVKSLVGVVGKIGWTCSGGDWNGITVYPDKNGEFDLNLTIPYVSNSAGSTIGRADLNTLRAHSTLDGDVNAVFIIAPKITTAADMNVTVTVNSRTYSVEDALFQRLITDFNTVSNFIVRMGNIVAGLTTPARRQMEILFNGNVNLKTTPVADYSADMSKKDGNSGFVSIDSTKLPEFAIDANINMYNVKVPSAAMPAILKDSKVCSSTVCTNQDGTALSTEKAWSYNPAGGDGNLSFRVTGFSSYEASPFSLEVQTPNGGEKIRTPRHGGDANYTVQFRFKDQNTMDNNTSKLPLRGLIYYSTKSGAKTGVIINDFNLFDTIGIRCNGWSKLTSDVNLADWVTCVYDLNRSDLNKIIGEYVIDVNVASHAGRVPEQSMLDSSDANLFINPPLIEILDTNISGGNFVVNPRRAVADINYIVDFNIYLPDINKDQNFSLADYNIHFYLGATQTSLAIGGGASDLNVLGVSQQFDQNFRAKGEGWDTNTASYFKGVNMQCISPPATAPYLDYKCKLQYDVNGVFENKSYLIARILNNQTRTTNYGTVDETGAKVVVTHVVDINELWDINATPVAFSINDSNVPRARFGTSYGSVERTVYENSYNLVLYCDDNTSGPYQYLFREPGITTWTSNGTSDTLHLSVPTALETKRTFQGGCLDYAGNISDINSTTIITFRPPGTKSVTPSGPDGGGGGAPGSVVEGTETIVVVETQGTPTELAVESVLTDAGFTTQEIATAMQFATSTAIGQKVAVDKITTATGATYSTLVSIKVTNHSNKKWENVKVVAEIPKALATDASHVKSSFAMKVLKADPIIEFTVPEIQVGQTVNVIYSVAKNISDVTARAILIGMVIGYAEVAPCEGVTCESDACTTGTCNSTTGNCDYAYKADGTACGTGKECKAGACIEKTAPPAPPVQPTAPDYTMLIVLVVIIVLVIAGAAFYAKKGKKKKGL